MKKIKLLLAAFAAVFTLGASAQTWTAPEVPVDAVGEGSFLLFNLGSGQYFTKGNGWGTQASITTSGLTADALPVQLVAVGDDYQIRTGVNGAAYGLEHLAGDNGGTGTIYTDQSRNKLSTWAFELVEDNLVYTIIATGTEHGGGAGVYLAANQSNTIVGPGNDGSDPYAQWQLVPTEGSELYLELYDARVVLYNALIVAEEEGIDTSIAGAVYTNPDATVDELQAALVALDDARKEHALDVASEDNPVDVTSWFIVNPTPVNDLNGWTGNAIGGHDNGVAEFWNNAAFSYQQTVHLPAGLYELSLVALTRTNMVATLEAAGQSVNIATVGNNIVNTRSQAAAWFNQGNGVNVIRFQINDEADVTIKLTADNTTGDHWLVWRNYTLNYLGRPSDPLAFYKDQLAAAVQKAYEVEGNIPLPALEALQNYSEELNRQYATHEEYEEATAAILARIADVKALPAVVDAYEALKPAVLALPQQQVYTGTATLSTDAADAAIEAATTTAEANAAIAQLRQAAADFIGAVTVNEGEYFDITNVYLTNADFSAGNIEGWETNYESGVQAQNIGYQASSYTTEKEDGNVTISQFIEAWRPSGTLGDGYLRQTVQNLPAGKYGLEADVMAVNQNTGVEVTGALLYINADGLDFTTNLNTANNKPEHFATEFLFSGEGDVQFGLKTVNATANWIGADNFTIKYYGVSDLSDYQEQLNSAVEVAVEALSALEGQLPESISGYGDDLIALFLNAEYESADEYLEAIDLVNSTVIEARAMVAPYAEYLDLKRNAESLKESAVQDDNLFAGLDNALSLYDGEEAYTADDLLEDIAALKEAVYVFIAGAVPVDAMDLTFLLNNPTPVANKALADGWEGDAFGDSSHGVSEYWNKAAASFHQTVTLPAGLYLLQATALGRTAGKDQDGVDYAGSESRLVAGEESVQLAQVSSTVVNSRSEAKAWFEAGNGRNNLFFEVLEDGEVELGIEADANNHDHWTVWSNFALSKVADVPALDIDENEDFLGGEFAGNVTLKRSFTTNWNTLVVPFQITHEELVAAFGDNVEVAVFEDVPETVVVEEAVLDEQTQDVVTPAVVEATENSTIKLTTLNSPAVAANVPVLIKVENPQDEYVFVNRTLIDYTEPVVAGTNFNFVGVYNQTTVADGDYFFNADKVFRSEGDTELKATRAFIQNVSGGEVKVYIDGVATAIRDIDGIVAAKANDAAIYNLAGQKVSKAVKGIYVQDGKKFIVK